MKAFFKDTNKLIVNSMDHQEALNGKTFLEKIANSTITIEARNDINDEFDGLVISLIPNEESTEEIIDENTEEVENNG